MTTGMVPSNARTTCVYEPSCRQMFVNTATGQRHTLTMRRTAYRSSYRDQGPVRFGGCLSKVVRRDARHAWRRANPKSLIKLSQLDPLLHEVSAPPPPDDRREDIVELLAQIPSSQIRHVMEDVLEYLTVRESAKRRGLSKSTVDRYRQAGRAIIQRLVRSED